MTASWPADRVERRRLATLRPFPRNARTHSPEQVAQVPATSLAHSDIANGRQFERLGSGATHHVALRTMIGRRSSACVRCQGVRQ
jgi:hypothetical protein